jgi:hypothetical protein
MVAVRCNLRQYRQTEILGLAAGNQMLTQKRRHAKVVSRREIRAALSRNHIIFQGCHTCDSGWFTIVCVCVCGPRDYRVDRWAEKPAVVLHTVH